MVTRHSSSIKKRFLGRRATELELDCLPRQQSLFRFCFSLEAVCATTSWRPQPPLAVTSKRRLRCNRPPNAAASSQALYASLLALLQVHRHLCRRQHHCHRCSCPQQRQCARRVLAAAPFARVPSDRLPLACARRCLLSSSNISLPLKPPNHLLYSMPIVDMLSRIATAARPLVRQMSGDAAHAAKDAALWKYIGFAATAGSLAFATVKVS